MMNTEKHTGRLVGAILLMALLLGLWNNFGLTAPIYAEPGWLRNGAQLPALFGSSALLGLVSSFMMLAVALLARPMLRQASSFLALAYVLLSTVVVATTAIEQANFLAMRSLSLQYTKHPELDPILFEIMRNIVGAARHGAHYLDKLLGGTSMLVLFLALFRSNSVPRLISVLGLLAAPVQMLGISLVLFMQPLNPILLAPLAVAMLLLSLTLLVKGFSPATGTRSPLATR